MHEHAVFHQHQDGLDKIKYGNPIEVREKIK